MVFGIILLRHEDIILLRVISSLTFTSSVANVVCNGNKYSKEMMNF